MFKTIYLKQHSPMIHFHPHQSDATLRASDLKPRIIKYLAPNADRKPVLKIQLKPLNKIPKLPSAKWLEYLNQGVERDKTKVKKELICFEKIELKILLINPEYTYDMVNEAFKKNLILENFGTSSNKGFGCFYFDECSIEDFEKSMLEVVNKSIFCFECKFSDAFKKILMISQFLKTGYGIRNKFSFLEKYVKKEMKDSWDKDILKAFVKNGIVNNNMTYVRSIFGLGKDQEWNIEKKMLRIQASLDRIPSPFIYKIFQYPSDLKSKDPKCKIYFWVKYPHNIDEKFNFTVEDIKSKKKLRDGLIMNSPRDFDFEKYMEFIFNESKSVDSFKLNLKRLK